MDNFESSTCLSPTIQYWPFLNQEITPATHTLIWHERGRARRVGMSSHGVEIRNTSAGVGGSRLVRPVLITNTSTTITIRSCYLMVVKPCLTIATLAPLCTLVKSGVHESLAEFSGARQSSRVPVRSACYCLSHFLSSASGSQDDILFTA